MPGPEEKNKMTILHLPWLKTVKGLDSFQALNPNCLKDFSEQCSIIPNWRGVRGKLQKQIKGLGKDHRARSAEVKALGLSKRGERDTLITV